MDRRYMCIHGHFYQPPRENPWLEAIEIQDSAHPFHDWNERITAECYGPNATARILDKDGMIEEIVNNYAKISFNMGPTLLSWMEQAYPRIYKAIIAADRKSQKLFGGHGSAMAQVYNHMIMPLATEEEKRTQVRWGIRDFVRRFGRQPEGMWLAETAVDTASLEALAAEGIGFTLLAPHQAGRIRPLAGGPWQSVEGTGGPALDTTRAYTARLPSGRSIQLFFYNGPISRAVAFEHLLRSGEDFAHRLLGSMPEGQTGLIHIATDGETYGHHHKHGDMALAYALRHIEQNNLATLTNYGQFLELYPPTHEVEIVERTSWSCAHGVGRWYRDCGCHSGGNPGWHQRWRGPLRDALDQLRAATMAQFDALAPEFFPSPAAARDAYIDVILDRSHDNVKAFLQQHAPQATTETAQNKALKLLEIQRNSMLMYTSCGWFFDEISGIEASQVLQYAGRAIQLADTFPGPPLEPAFVAALEAAPSNLPAYRHGRDVYDKFVRPASVDFRKLVAHYAVTSLFNEEDKHANVYAFSIIEQEIKQLEAGRARLLLGRVEARSQITWGSAVLSFGILHLGDHNISGGVRTFRGKEAFELMREEVSAAFLRAEFPEVLRLLDRHFLDLTYSMRTLFRDQQRKVLNQVLAATIEEAEQMARHLYQQHAPLLRFVSTLDFPLPKNLRQPIAFVLNARLQEAFATLPLPRTRIKALLAEAEGIGVKLDTPSFAFAFQCTLEQLADAWERQPDALESLEALNHAASLLEAVPFATNLYHVQNIFHLLRQTHESPQRALAATGQESATQWLALFCALAQALHIRLAPHLIGESTDKASQT